jgi:RNA polymerase sigma-70 factor (ECF subfamily)
LPPYDPVLDPVAACEAQPLSAREETPAELQLGRWMEAAQRGDAEAYEKLLRALLPPLRDFVRRLVRDPDEAEDIVQSVLFSLHRFRHTWRPERPFGPWWRAIARNAATDALRKRSRSARREIALDDAPEIAAPEFESRADAAIDPALADAMRALPDAQRKAVEMVHLEDLSMAEAAERAGVGVEAMKTRSHRGIAALRRLLGGRPS